MRVDEGDEHSPTFGRELQAAGDLVSKQGASLLVVTCIRGLAGVVEQDGEIEDGGILELLKNRPVALKSALFGEKHRVEFFDAHEGMFVGGVAVVELVLNEAIPARRTRECIDRARRGCA